MTAAAGDDPPGREPASAAAPPDEDALRTVGLVDEGRLAAWMDERELGRSGEPVQATFITGGASNELFEVRRGDLRLALRRPPRRAPEGRNETMLREHRLLAALAGSDVPHARAVAACDDTDVIGGCFYLMEFVEGWSPLGGGGWPPPFDRDLEGRRGLAFELVDGIARLARVDWRAVGLEGFGRPDGFHERQVDRWMRHLDAVRFRELPGMDEAAAWLRAHKPRAYEPGIMHGDYQFANVMFRHGAPARLAAIVDWEMATVGDPLLDLGWVIQGWLDPDEARSTGSYVDYTGMPSRAELLDYYATHSGRDTSDIDYYVVLARFKLAAVLEAGYARAVQGDADNPKMLAFGDVVLDLARRAGERRLGVTPSGLRTPGERFDLRGRVALVTGGSRGLGRAMALGLAGAGADVAVVSRKLDACRAVAAEIEGAGGRAAAVACNVSHWDDLAPMVDEVEAALGAVDILVNNAGMSLLYGEPTNVTEAMWDKVIGLNLKGVFRLTAIIGTRMAAARGGSIVTVSTVGSIRPTPWILPYAAAKAGVNALTVGFARTFGPTVRVNCVMPGPFLTDVTRDWDMEAFEAEAERRHALQRAGEPDEIVGAVLYLASDASSFTTGAVIRVDGGIP